MLQVRERDSWKTVYRADWIPFLSRQSPRAIVRNGVTEQELEQQGFKRSSAGGGPPWGCLVMLYAGACLFAAIHGRWKDFVLLTLLGFILFPLFAFGARRVNRIDYGNH